MQEHKRPKQQQGPRNALSPLNSAGTRYSWFSQDDSLSNRQYKADSRRQQLLDKMSDSNLQTDERDKIVSEWIALLKERDRILRMKLDQENEESREMFFRELNLLLHHLPEFTSADQHVLDSLIKFKSQIGEYCASNNIPDPLRRCLSVPTLSPSASYPLPPPPNPSERNTPHLSPPPMSELPTDFSLYPTKEACNKPRSRQFPGPAQPKSATLPRKLVAADETDHPSTHQLSAIRLQQACGAHSRQTSLLDDHRKVKRPNLASGKGTPSRTRHPLNSELSHGDMLQRALKKKFRNVHSHSTPKRHGTSYLRKPSGGISESASGTWSENCGYASDPDISLGSYSDIQTSSARSAGDLMMDTTCESPSLGVTRHPNTDEDDDD